MSNINVNNLTPLLGSGSSVSVSGSLVVKNDVTIGGHLYIGDEDTDSVTFTAEVSSSIVPDANVTYDLGSSAKKWSTIYLNSLVTHHITASGNISASGTGTNGTGSFHHVAVNGNVTSSGTGSYEGGIIANNATGSFGYVSASGDMSASGDIYGTTGSFIGGIDAGQAGGTGSFGYISASGDISTSHDIYGVTGSFIGGISSSGATGSFGQVTAEGDISSSGTGSFMDVFVDDMVEIQGDINLHGNISSSLTGSFGYISASGDVSSSGTGSFFGGVDAAGATGSFGYVSASGDISTSTNIYGVQYYTDSLIFATGDQSLNTVKLGGGASVTQIHGVSIDITGSISMSGNISMSGAGQLSTGQIEAKDGKIILTDTQVAHGITNHIQTDAYGDLGPIHATRGGLLVNGTSDQESADARSLTLRGLCNDSHTDTVPVVEINAAKRSGTAVQALEDAETVLQIQNYTTSLIDVLGNGDTTFIGDISVGGEISASYVSASGGFQADTLSTSSFGLVSASNISSSGTIKGNDYYAGNLQFATADNTNTLLQIGGSQPLRIKGTSISITGSISMSGDLVLDENGVVFAPYYSNWHTVTNDQVLTATSSGVPIVISADATVQLPAVAVGLSYWVYNGNNDGTKITVSPNSNDKFLINAAGATGTDNKDLVLTAGTAETGDFVKITYGSADGWTILERAGTWADES